MNVQFDLYLAICRERQKIESLTSPAALCPQPSEIEIKSDRKKVDGSHSSESGWQKDCKHIDERQSDRAHSEAANAKKNICANIFANKTRRRGFFA